MGRNNKYQPQEIWNDVYDPVTGSLFTANNSAQITKNVSYSAVTVTAITCNTASVNPVALNNSRKALKVVSAATGNIWYQFSSVAATATATGKLTPYAEWEMPDSAVYSGPLSFISDTTTGLFMITEG